MENGSVRWSLNTMDWQKVLKGGYIALIGALLTHLTSIITNTDFVVSGVNLTPLVMLGWSILTNIVKKWITDNSKAQ